MESFLTLSNILGVISIVGVIFAIYKSYRDPQAKSETIDSLLTLRMDNIEKSLTNLKDNHLHTLETKLDSTNGAVKDLLVEVTKLGTIISERIPRKQ